ncbi:MAG: hypothetical protein RJA70_4858 [Pseudomonadota bacterium]|jgi:hypothetical protein
MRRTTCVVPEKFAVQLRANEKNLRQVRACLGFITQIFVRRHSTLRNSDGERWRFSFQRPRGRGLNA